MTRKTYTLVLLEEIPHRLFEHKDNADAYVDEVVEKNRSVGREDFNVWWPVPVHEGDSE